MTQPIAIQGIRRDGWTPAEDKKLVKIILEHISRGSTQLKAFEEASETLKNNRTASACGFRWNSELREKNIRKFNKARQEAIAARRSKGKTTAFDKVPKIMLKSVKEELDKKAAQEAAKLEVEAPKKEVAKVEVKVATPKKSEQVSDTFYDSFIKTVKEHAVLEHKYAQLQKQNARLKKENEELKAAQK